MGEWGHEIGSRRFRISWDIKGENPSVRRVCVLKSGGNSSVRWEINLGREARSRETRPGV